MNTNPDDQAIVYVVDDGKSVRESIEDLLTSISLRSMTFPSAQAFIMSERPEAPACLVLNVRMPGSSGLECQQALTRMGIYIPIIFVTAYGDVPTSVKAMKAGAIEFLIKPFHDQELLDAINRGVSRDRARRQIEDVRKELRRRHASLPDGERAVMKLVVDGLLNKQIASRLLVSEITVKVRRSHIMRK